MATFNGAKKMAFEDDWTVEEVYKQGIFNSNFKTVL